ncbi:MAG: VWA domain-containing protein [Pyrinomonadaceae bacterium]|nr:VWA domain-containing protein [Pyrinomonadaceae bacterium]
MHDRLHTRFGFACAVFACVVGTAVTTSAQAQRPGNEQTPDKLVINSAEVPFDVVVRDRKGRSIKDLKPSDFEVYEDGVRQEINSFQLVSHTNVIDAKSSTDRSNNQKPANDSGSATRTQNRAEPPSVSAIALVFDRLSPGARARATQAALSYLGESVSKSELFGVFLTDLSVLVLQPFTDDRQLVRLGIEKAGSYSPSLYASTNEEARVKRKELTDAVLLDQNRSTGLEGSANPALRSPALAMAQMELHILERSEEDQRDQLGDASTRGLLLIASSLRPIPGRKAVIFFSEGLILPPSVMETLRAIINAANRNNVSFYTVDAAGLRVESKTTETNLEIASRSGRRMAQLGSNADPTGPMTKGLERNEDLLRLNPDSGLGQLANETGGFLITDSNDLKSRLRQVDEDLHTYYLMSYSSKNQNYDGHFRRIEVKLKRSDLIVQSRKGYYAIKGTFASPVLAYEPPALAALDRAPSVNAFPFYVGGFSFPERQRLGLAPVLVDVPLSAFTFHVDQQKQLYDTDFCIVALLKDHAGQVVKKLSSQYRLTGPLDKIEEAKLGRVLFYRQVDLAPGRYTLETIAYDAPTGRASVRTGTIEVSASDEGKLRLSDVIILKRAEPANVANEKQSNPFHVDNMIVSPNLGEPIPRSLKQVPFFFTVYTTPGSSTQPKLTIELRQQGRTLVQIPADLPKVDTLGRIQYLAGVPLEKIPPGSYELRITVNDETTSVARSGYFTIQD